MNQIKYLRMTGAFFPLKLIETMHEVDERIAKIPNAVRI